MQTYERKSHKLGKIISASVMGVSFICIIVFSVLSLLLGLESFVTHFVAFVFGIIVGLLLQKKSKGD